MLKLIIIRTIFQFRKNRYQRRSPRSSDRNGRRIESGNNRRDGFRSNRSCFGFRDRDADHDSRRGHSGVRHRRRSRFPESRSASADTTRRRCSCRCDANYYVNIFP